MLCLFHSRIDEKWNTMLMVCVCSELAHNGGTYLYNPILLTFEYSAGYGISTTTVTTTRSTVTDIHSLYIDYHSRWSQKPKHLHTHTFRLELSLLLLFIPFCLDVVCCLDFVCTHKHTFSASESKWSHRGNGEPQIERKVNEASANGTREKTQPNSETDKCPAFHRHNRIDSCSRAPQLDSIRVN